MRYEVFIHLVAVAFMSASALMSNQIHSRYTYARLFHIYEDHSIHLAIVRMGNSDAFKQTQ